jgi:hypothetical protein
LSLAQWSTVATWDRRVCSVSLWGGPEAGLHAEGHSQRASQMPHHCAAGIPEEHPRLW